MDSIVIAQLLLRQMTLRNAYEMAARMHTSRMVVNRLLDERDTSVTLATLARASVAVGLPLRFELAGAVA
jgi:antitoxin HicB